MNKEEIDQHIKSILTSLPDKPGVYQFFNSRGTIIYVGKAINLKKRVSSYFQKEKTENHKVRIMVRHITDINYIVVNNETDALLLENNLIKKYQPRYNVQLKDDKTFPWICIKNERFPRIFPTRNVVKDGSLYFGPYTSMKMVRMLMDLIRKLYYLRTCNYVLTQENIQSGKYKACLEYHIGLCKAPCEGRQSEEDYQESIDQIKKILNGNMRWVIQYLYKVMDQYAKQYDFEKAHAIKEKITLLEKYQSRSTVVNPSIDNVDVFSMIDGENEAYINFLKVANGAIIKSHTLELKKKLYESPEHLLELGILYIRDKLQSDSSEILIPFPLENNIPGVKQSVPKKGDKKKLLDLSHRNAEYQRLEKLKRKEQSKYNDKNERLLQQVQKDLQLRVLPSHIECFDNSNLQGHNPVASCVVFREGKPSKNEYRKFQVQTVGNKPDDYASMREIVYRRYYRLVQENEALPQLVIIDGGKGQLSAALDSLTDLNLHGSIPVIGIAKRLEEIYYPGDPVPLYLDKNSETLRLIQRIRDEAHRFGITYHRNKRSKTALDSELYRIKGVGEKTIQALIEHFKTPQNIKSAKKNELKDVVGKQKAQLIFEYFHQDKY